VNKPTSIGKDVNASWSEMDRSSKGKKSKDVEDGEQK
jgi:hypothetical protein